MSIPPFNPAPAVALAAGFIGEPSFFASPREVLSAYTIGEVATAMAWAQQRADNGYWVAGFVAYEAAAAFDPALPTHAGPLDEPLLWFGVFDEPDLQQVNDASSFTSDFKIGDWSSEITEVQYQTA